MSDTNTLALRSDDTLIMELFSILDSLLAVHAGIWPQALSGGHVLKTSTACWSCHCFSTKTSLALEILGWAPKLESQNYEITNLQLRCKDVQCPSYDHNLTAWHLLLHHSFWSPGPASAWRVVLAALSPRALPALPCPGSVFWYPADASGAVLAGF